MANANQPPSSMRQQGRQQTSEPDKTNSPSAQQGGQDNDPAGQQSAWQEPSANQQPPGPMQARRGAAPVESPYRGRFDSGLLSMMRRISEDLDRFFESFGFGRGMFPAEFGRLAGEGFPGPEASSLWMPHIELYEHDGKLVINAELPGVKKKDVSVEITPDAVTIRGQRKQEKPRSEGGLYRNERSYGSFYRTIPLPEGVDAETASASFRDGVLQIEMNAPQRRARVRTLQISDDTGTTSRATAGAESKQMGGGSHQR